MAGFYLAQFHDGHSDGALFPINHPAPLILCLIDSELVVLYELNDQPIPEALAASIYILYPHEPADGFLHYRLRGEAAGVEPALQSGP